MTAGPGICRSSPGEPADLQQLLQALEAQVERIGELAERLRHSEERRWIALLQALLAVPAA